MKDKIKILKDRIAELEEEKINIEGELEDQIAENAALTARIAELTKERRGRCRKDQR